MLDKQFEIKSLQHVPQTSSVGFLANLQNKSEDLSKRNFKESYVKMRQNLDKQLVMTRDESLRKTVSELKAQGLPSWDLQVLKAERKVREAEKRDSRVQAQQMGDRMLGMAQINEAVGFDQLPTSQKKSIVK